MFRDVIRHFDCKKDIRYGYTPRPLEGSVCVVGEGNLILFFLVTYARHQQLLFSLIIYRVYPGAFLMHLIEYALLRESGGYPTPCMGSGAKPVTKNCFRAFLRAKMSPQDTQLNTISYIFLPKSN